MEETKTYPIIWISPYEIKDVDLRGEVLYNRGLSLNDYVDAAKWISVYKSMKDVGIDEDKILKIKPMREAYDMFFKKPIRVRKVSDGYLLDDDGRHRVKAACTCPTIDKIPVNVVSVE